MDAGIPFNDLGRAARAQHGVLSSAMDRVLRSGWYVLGPEHDAFERELAAYVGVPHAVAVGNGTDALEIALLAAGVSAGDEVVTAANAGGYTTTAALKVAAIPRYADVHERHLQLTAETIEPLLGARTKAVVVTHLYGQMAPAREIAALCADRGIVMIEDCAQATGARRGAAAGSFGDLATFSFYPTKNLAALGDGGAVVAREEGRAQRVRQLRQYGWTQRYHAAVPGGRNSRLDEMQAAVLRVRLPLLDAANRRRRQISERYREAAPSQVQVLSGGDEDYVAHLCVATTADRPALAAALAAKGVSTAVHYPVPDHHQEVVLRLGQTQPSLPVTERLASQVLSLPCFPELVDEEVDRVCDALRTLQR